VEARLLAAALLNEFPVKGFATNEYFLLESTTRYDVACVA